MLDWWDRKMTDRVIRHMSGIRGNACKQIMALAEFVVQNDLNRYDPAMHSWAEGDHKVAAVLERVMKKRLATVTSLFRKAGFSRAEATARGHLFAIYIMGKNAVHIGDSIQTRLKLIRRQVRILTSQE
jgi:hypothetical protein